MNQEKSCLDTKKDCYLIELGWWIDYSRKIFKRGVIVPYDISDGYLGNNTNNTGIFKTTYMYNTYNQNESYLYGDYYLDFDNSDFELVRQDVIRVTAYFKIVFGIEYDDIQIFYSGNKGIHLIIDKDLLGTEPCKDLNLIYKSISVKCNEQANNGTIDMQIYDNKRMFRIVNSMNEKTNLYKIPLTHEELCNLSESDIKSLAICKRHFDYKKYVLNNRAKTMYLWFKDNYESILKVKVNVSQRQNSVLKYKPPCIDYFLEDGAPDGSRNNILAILASFYSVSGYDVDYAIDELSEWSSSLLSVPLDKRELLATIYSIYRSTKNFGCNSIKNYYSKCDNTCKFYKLENSDGGEKVRVFSFK